MQLVSTTMLKPRGGTGAAGSFLRASMGHASDSGGNRLSEDFFGSVTPQGDELYTRGILLALADGLSGGSGRAAAESIVYSVLSDYYATPVSLTVPQALSKVIGAVNRWLFGQNCSAGETGGMLTMLSVLVLHGDRFNVAHVGDSRIYRLRRARLEKITTDHVWRSGSMQRVLRRALGLDAQVLIDYADGDLKPGDIFLMVSDGVWEAVSEADLLDAIRVEPDPQQAARMLVERAVLRDSQFMRAADATAAVIRIDAM